MNKTQSEWDSRKVELNTRLNAVLTALNGGKGSGNFGHKGRPGMRGGSGNGRGTYAAVASAKKLGYKATGMSESTCGVPGDANASEIKEIPRLAGLSASQKKIEDEAISHYADEKERNKLIDGIVDAAEKKLAEGDRAIIETDDIKERLAEGWGTNAEYNPLSNKYKNYSEKLKIEEKMNEFLNKPKDEQDPKTWEKLQKDYDKVKDAKPLSQKEQARFDELRAFRAENNSLLHQTANAIAKGAFEKLASKHQGEVFGITLGGCASGKGFGLEHPELFSGTYRNKNLSDYTKDTKIWWDSAGEQGGDELNWFTSVAKNNKAKSVTYINTETNASAAARNAGGRVAEKGRLVSFEAFYDSYVKTRKNFETFSKANSNDPALNFITVKNMGKGSSEPPTVMSAGDKLSAFPTKSEMKKVYQQAVQSSGLPPSVENAAMSGLEFTFSFK